ncbi:hypothetical protein LIER_32431 [Lithospermum erythrorhizon]|uniref:Uncharacterized protein n=1 Tax=Lithospermum erythrorhizon TaxID=34254 RepID=A0AAV3RTT6_LITER
MKHIQRDSYVNSKEGMRPVKEKIQAGTSAGSAGLPLCIKGLAPRQDIQLIDLLDQEASPFEQDGASRKGGGATHPTTLRHLSNYRIMTSSSWFLELIIDILQPPIHATPTSTPRLPSICMNLIPWPLIITVEEH